MPKKRERQADTDTSPAPVAEVVAPVVREWEEKPEKLSSKFTKAYDEEKKNELLRRVLENGEHVALVAREIGIDRSTLHTWLAELKEEREAQAEFDSMRLADMFTTAVGEFLSAVDKTKLAQASVRDLAIAAGIAADKRRDLLGPRKGSAISRLRIAWKDGSGAVEVETGGG